MSRAWPVEGIEPDGTLADNARRILAVRMAEYYSYAPIVQVEEAVEALHDLRIAAKRLRYTLELFQDVFGETGRRNIERVKAIQQELGDVHDHDVRISLIDEELASLEAAGERPPARSPDGVRTTSPSDHSGNNSPPRVCVPT
jgi:CHAD domain-containing protein